MPSRSSAKGACGGGLQRTIMCGKCERGRTGSAKDCKAWAQRHAKVCETFASQYDELWKSRLSEPIRYHHSGKSSNSQYDWTTSSLTIRADIDDDDDVEPSRPGPVTRSMSNSTSSSTSSLGKRKNDQR